MPKELSNYDNDKYYIGITCCGVNKRWKNGNGYSTQKLFFRAINKYGWDNMLHYVISDKLKEIDADKYEKKLISELKTNIPMYGYNINAGGICSGGCSIKVAQYDLDGHLLQVYPSITDAKIKNNISEGSSTISAALDKNAQSHGYMWRTVIDFPIQQITPYTPYSSNVAIEQYSLDGSFIKEWKSIKEASDFYNTVAITNVCRGKALTAAGFQWKYKSDTKVMHNIYDCDLFRKRIYVYTIDGKFLNVYDSIVNAVKDLQINVKRPYLDLSHCYADIQKNYSHGYRWCDRYYEELPPLKLKKTQKPVLKIKDDIIINVYTTSSEASKENNVTISKISAYCSGREIDLNGYLWKHINQIEEENFISNEIKDKYNAIKNIT